MPRSVVPVPDSECLNTYAQQQGVALGSDEAALLNPIVQPMRGAVWVSKDVVSTLLDSAGRDKSPAWKQDFLAGAASVEAFLTERDTALLGQANAAALIHVDAANGTTYSPDGFGNLVMMLGGELGDKMKTLFSRPNTAASIARVADTVYQQRLQLRNSNADDINANQVQIAQMGVGDQMFLPRMEQRFYRGTIESMAETLDEAGYTRVETRGSKRKFHKLDMSTNRRQEHLFQGIVLQQSQPGGVLANDTPAQTRQRMRNINDASIASYNAPRGTLARRREDAVVPRR